MTRPSTDVGASASNRLKALARAPGYDFNLTLTRYGCERLLYRLSQSQHRDAFMRKGATLFVVDEGVDTGPIIAQSAVAVEDDDDVSSLHERIKVAERQMLVDSVGRIAREGFTISQRKVKFG